MTAPVRTDAVKSMNDEIVAWTPASRGHAEEVAGTGRLFGRAHIQLRYRRDDSC